MSSKNKLLATKTANRTDVTVRVKMDDVTLAAAKAMRSDVRAAIKKDTRILKKFAFLKLA